MVFYMERVEDFTRQHIGKIFNRLGAVVKSRAGGKDDRARSRKLQKIFQVNRAHGRFPRH